MKLRENRLTAGILHLWLWLTLFALGSLADVMDYEAHRGGGVIAVVGLTCLAMFKSSVLTAVYALCRNRLWLRTPAVVLIAVFMLLSLLNGSCWLFYGFGISRKLFTLIAETNQAEVMEFIPELGSKLWALVSSLSTWVAVIVFAALWIYLPRVSPKWLARIIGALSCVGLVYLVFVFATADLGRTSHSVLARSYRCVAAFRRDKAVISELMAMKRPFPYPETLASTRAAERIVVIIGESASRDHLSLYGYPLETSPRLDTVTDGLYRFDNAVASSGFTAGNMPRLVSFMTDEPGGKEWYEYPSLLQLFHELGYRTYWLSNQESSGKWSNLSSILSSDADVVKYVGSIDSEDHYTERYDDVLLPEWRQTLESSDSLQLTFMHLMGSHFRYANRYPATRHHITGADVMEKLPREWLGKRKAEVVAAYDNSILYTDSILAEVLEGIRRSPVPTVAVYLSDHGENVYDDRDYRGRDPRFVDVPFIIYANAAYRAKNKNIIEDIERSLTVPFSTSGLAQMLMHLSGTAYRYYDPSRDPLSTGFKVRRRYVDDEPYYKD